MCQYFEYKYKYENSHFITSPPLTDNTPLHLCTPTSKKNRQQNISTDHCFTPTTRNTQVNTKNEPIQTFDSAGRKSQPTQHATSYPIDFLLKILSSA
jgi:hypothetical protein